MSLLDRSPLARLLDGPPIALPALFDGLSERWWRARPRTRAAMSIGTGLVLLAAGVGHVAASPWGTPVTVLVAAGDLEIGDRLGAGDVLRRSWPSELVPEGALHDPVGTVVAPVPAGAVVTARHVTEGGIGAALPADRAAVPLLADALPEVPRGARIDLVAADLDARGVTVARDARVLASDGVHVWLAVDHAVAADVAAAAAAGRLTAVVLPE